MSITLMKVALSIRDRLMRSRFAHDAGFTTAEYAIGTVAVAGLGGILIKILSSDLLRELLWSIIRRALELFLPF